VGLVDIGSNSNEEVEIAQEVLKHMKEESERFKESPNKREISGYLLGKRNESGKISVSSFIYAGPGSDIMTILDNAHEKLITQEEELKKKGLGVVGWYHSHPGYDPWYSEYEERGVGTMYGLAHDLDTHLQLQLEHGPIVGIVIEPKKGKISAQKIDSKHDDLVEARNSFMNAEEGEREEKQKQLMGLIRLKFLKIMQT
jgi:proteasome lid subunit RPN8/RPN11